MCTYRSDNSREPIQTRRDTAMVTSRLPLDDIYELMNLGAGQSIHMHDSTGAVFTCGSPPPASSEAKPPRASGLRRMHDTPHGCSCKPRSSHAYHAAVRAWHRRASPRALFIVVPRAHKGARASCRSVRTSLSTPWCSDCIVQVQFV